MKMRNVYVAIPIVP